MKWKLATAAVVLTATGLSANALYSRRADAAPEVIAEPVTRGSIVQTVAASGTLEAVTTVLVGTQISGTVDSLYADFNTIVKKGQVIARLDPSLVQAEIDQARAALIRAEAEVERLDVSLADARLKATRARELANRELIPRTELETAELAEKTVEAQLRSARAQVTQARASLAQSEVTLSKTVIRSPIDGIVISRDVDVGQTVAASMQAPTLYEIAADLSQLQVRANIDESDVGLIKAGQPVRFTVDAYPNDQFTGRVVQVRLNPVVEQNVVTYAAIISAPNGGLKLRPGMTASVVVETMRRDDVLRVPSAALRFKPDASVLASLGAQKDSGSANHPRPVDVNTLWLLDSGLHPLTVRTGLSDGTVTEIAADGLEEGDRVAVRLAATTSSKPATPSSSPLMTTPQRRF
jgi:HlyD family secretion protein